MSAAVNAIVVSCCQQLVQSLLQSDTGIPIQQVNQDHILLLTNSGLARIDTHRGVKVIKGTKDLFDYYNK